MVTCSVTINSIFYDNVNCLYWLSQHSWLICALTLPSTLLFCLVCFFDIYFHSGTISSVILHFHFTLLNFYSDGVVDPPSRSGGIRKSILTLYTIFGFLGFTSTILHEQNFLQYEHLFDQIHLKVLPFSFTFVV